MWVLSNFERGRFMNLILIGNDRLRTKPTPYYSQLPTLLKLELRLESYYLEISSKIQRVEQICQFHQLIIHPLRH